MLSPHPYLATPLPRAFAHRGWHVGDLAGLENSLPAFRRAVAEGYHYVETDVHATSDGVVVVHHDALLDRTTDGTGPIARQTWSAVRRAKVGGTAPISRLEDVLEELPDAFFNVDVKAGDAVEPFLRVLRRTDAFHRVAAAAFSDARLARLRKLGGGRLITSLGPRSVAVLWANGWVPFLRLGFLSRGAMAQVPVTQGPMTIVDKGFLRSARKAGVEVHTWTINDQDEMRALLDLGVQGIVTDRPDLLRDVLVERGAWPGTGTGAAS
ncbi:glycerophosphodiester phosphodiesterase [Prauserella muralis]|uniref:Glycerophosphodiester phosphodiesterase n=1 Tax=Prauserella muralis TaxID=588067 RepID=A0A2V4AP43_9PSEU|nr:glycerophosphodiester phosphodiesterase [Prauserella muralis]PXY22470.1 glycerophosphodiester phosphodiesterase [Prauserella muralis]TWE28148.1 glycerophosphoryl diester phosphodiesterase [Prauserella muralis]